MLDGGPRQGALPELISRLPFPAEWRVLLIFDADASGLAGASETAAFNSLPDFPESVRPKSFTGASRKTRCRLWPTATSRLSASRSAICRPAWALISRPCKAGPYASPRVSDALAWLRSEGVTGLGQSSWGPTGFAFAASEAEGEALLGRLRAHVQRPGLSFALAQGRNEGAKIETSAREIQ